MGIDSDEACYRQYLDGDEEGLRELICRYGDKLTLYINGYLGDMNDAEDLMLESFSGILAKPREFHEKEGSFKAYLFKTGYRLALRYLRKHRRHRHFGLEDMTGEPACKELLEDIYFEGERDKGLHLAMGSLRPEYKEVLYLLYFEGMSYVSAAKVMGKTEKQITNLAYRSRQALRSILERRGMVHENHG